VSSTAESAILAVNRTRAGIRSRPPHPGHDSALEWRITSADFGATIQITHTDSGKVLVCGDNGAVALLDGFEHNLVSRADWKLERAGVRCPCCVWPAAHASAPLPHSIKCNPFFDWGTAQREYCDGPYIIFELARIWRGHISHCHNTHRASDYRCCLQSNHAKTRTSVSISRAPLRKSSRY
jgi:hypothetical protein